MSQLEEIKSLTDSLIDAVIDQGHCEFISSVAEPLPVTVFLRMFGLPVDRLAEFRDLVHEVLNPPPGTHQSPMILRKVADALVDDIAAEQELARRTPVRCAACSAPRARPRGRPASAGAR